MTTTSCVAASRWLSPASAPVLSQNAASFSGVRQYATTCSIDGTAARMHATCVSAWWPQPMTPRVLAPDFARWRAATPLAAPVRSCPSRSASMTATSADDSASKRQTTKVAPFGVAA